MATTVTVTGTAGPGLTVSALVFNNVSVFTIDSNQNMLFMTQGSVVLPGVSINAATTVTATKSANNWTLTIS